MISTAFAMLLVAMAVILIVRAIVRSDATSELGHAIGARDADRVRAVLIARGHFLRKRVRDDAQVWLLEQEQRGGGR
jgi:hypothetical protein